MTSPPDRRPTSRGGAPAGADEGLGRARIGLLALSLSAFAAVTTEVLPVGLLPQIGRAFDEGPSTTGLLVSLYAGLVAVLAVPLTLATRRLPRKPLLLATLGSYVVSDVVVAIAPSFAVVAVGRAVGGATHALFFSVAIGYASRLVPPGQTGRAMALASSGGSAGFVLGVPLATSLGNATGWRTAFAALGVLLVVTTAVVAWTLPPVGAGPEAADAGAGHRGRLAAVAGSNALTFVGHYTLYTFITLLLLRSGAPGGAVGPVLLVFGAVGLVGLTLAARQLDQHPRRTALAVLGCVAAGLAGAGAGFPVLAGVVAAGVVWNAAFGAVASVYQTLAVRTRATSPELAGAWTNASANVGIAVGAALGGAVLDHAGVQTVAWVAAAMVVAAITVALTARSAFPRTP